MEPRPFFSVVIPTYNRPERLEQCLQSLTRLDYPRDRFEVVVVDDGSKVPMSTVIDSFESQLPVRLLRQQNAGPASARNAGAAAARGRYLAFTDDDCQPASDWLTAIAAAFTEAPDALIGGYTINALPENLYSTGSQLLIDYLYDYYNRSGGEATFFASNNFAMPRDAFHKIGGFDTTFPLAAGEDREFCDRWQHHELPMRYIPNMQIRHTHTLGLTSFWRQHFNYGRGAFHFHKVRSCREAEPVKVEPLTFYLQLLSYPLTRRQGWRSLSLSGLFFLSQVANVAGFFQERRRNERPTLSPTQ